MRKGDFVEATIGDLTLRPIDETRLVAVSKVNSAATSPESKIERTVFKVGVLRFQNFGSGMMNWPIFTTCVAGSVAILAFVSDGNGANLTEPILTSRTAPKATASDLGLAKSSSLNPVVQSATVADSKSGAWVIPDIDKLPDDAWGKIVRYGRRAHDRDIRLCGS